MKLVIQQLMSGKDEKIWISLGFSSEFQEHDVLHVVCSEGDEPGLR